MRIFAGPLIRSMLSRGGLCLLLSAGWCTFCTCLCAQTAPSAIFRPQAVPPAPPSLVVKDYEFTCPGSFPSDLTVVNCRYQVRQRLEQFLTTGITDQAMLESVTGSLFTQLLKTPGEWPRTWKYYGYRVGASYAQSVGNASAQFIVGAILQDDPRHVSCSSDPLLFHSESTADKPFTCSKWHRFGHALLDSVSVRHSNSGTLTPQTQVDLGLALSIEDARKKYKSHYHRLPALSRLVGAYAGAYAQYPWEPGHSNKFGAVSQRAALSFAPTFLGSFYTEYGTSIFSRLKRAKK
jgi:hypothetical protein